jgi:3-phosphoshikimate 1-carboxyvinyltransferase
LLLIQLFVIFKSSQVLVKRLVIHNTTQSLVGEIHLPASKSLSNRALIINHLCGKRIKINNLSNADDTALMVHLLTKIEECKGSIEPVLIDCYNAGTVARFLTALLAITPRKWIITGSDRMKERPIGILAESLIKLGANIQYQEINGFLPLLIEGTTLEGRVLEINGNVSSQFITALLLIAPTILNGLNLRINGKISSFPYIEMTIKLLNSFGIATSLADNTIRIGQQDYSRGEFNVEPDWTSASYWYEMAALASEVNLSLIGLSKASLQGDSILPFIFNHFGVNTEFLSDGIRLFKSGNTASEFTFDFTNYPDLAQAVIVTCAGLNIQGRFTGLESLRLKETDRLTALQNELIKLGFKIDIVGKSELKIQNSEFRTRNLEPIQTYGDHRMAMALAPLVYRLGSVQIENPSVVSKSYPEFWNDLKMAGLQLIDVG